MELYESVPNISCGRNTNTIARIVSKLSNIANVTVMHVDEGYDTDRTVLTLAGSSLGLLEATFVLYCEAFNLINIQQYKGNHPTIGSVDVCPFIPLQNGASMKTCITMSHQLATRIAQELDVPVFLYSNSAIKENYRELSNLRKGGLRGLSDRMNNYRWLPDYGKNLSDNFGATIIGARDILIAYNIDLNTTDINIAKSIASQIRESSTGNYALAECRAIGWFLKSSNKTQVSINLRNYRITGLHDAYRNVQQLAQQYGTEITGSEIIGLTPIDALIRTGLYACNLGGNDDIEHSEARKSHLCEQAIRFLKLKGDIFTKIIEITLSKLRIWPTIT